MKKKFFLFFWILAFSPALIHAECEKGSCVNGKGTFIFPDGAKYTGEWKDGKKEGAGKYTWPNGTLYTGEFRDDKPQGKGKIMHPDGSEKFVIFAGGRISESKRIKSGPFRGELSYGEYTNGGKYRGWFKGDKYSGFKPHGRGCMAWDDSAKYAGQWKNGRMHGRGRMIWPDGSSYEGEWVMGKRTGYGTYTWPGGTRYCGQWKENKRHGIGTQITDEGKVYDGAWDNGNFVNNARI